MAEIFEAQLQVLAATLRPKTIDYSYRVTVRRFLRYLRTAYPEVRRFDQLHRDPHILGWLRRLAEERLANKTRTNTLICMRRLLEDLADNGQPVRDGLIFPQDFPPRDTYLPRPLAPEVDRRLRTELHRIDDLPANALLLIRFTGMRAGECLRLGRDSLRCIGGNDWALHVPLGKLHTERWVPVDNDTRNIFARIYSLAGAIPSGATDPPDPLFVMPNGTRLSYLRMRETILSAARSLGSPPIGAHQLRHTFATELVRAGITLPALQQILGHSDVNMTLRYVQVTQNDLQREYRLVRSRIATLHSVPQLPWMSDKAAVCGIAAIKRGLTALQHQFEMYRRQVRHERTQRTLHRLARRLAAVRAAIETVESHQK
jgi:site-specific recombinase XerD